MARVSLPVALVSLVLVLVGCWQAHPDSSALGVTHHDLGQGNGAAGSPAGAGQDQPTDPYVACQLEAKKCFEAAGDEALCGAMIQNCTPLASPPSAPEDDPYLSCQLEAKSCYAGGGDTSVCDALIQKCVPLAPPPSAPEDDAYVACELEAKKCYVAGGDPTVCDALVQKCSSLVPAAATPTPSTPGAR